MAENLQRIDCAKAAASFEFPRLAAIQHSGNDGPPIKIERLGECRMIRNAAFQTKTEEPPFSLPRPATRDDAIVLV